MILMHAWLERIAIIIIAPGSRMHMGEAMGKSMVFQYIISWGNGYCKVLESTSIAYGETLVCAWGKISPFLDGPAWSIIA